MYEWMKNKAIANWNRTEGPRGFSSHRAIYDAMVARNPTRARKAMQHHMDIARDDYFRSQMKGG
jgi:DNA-binding FadR family transcriptional regulator